MRTLDQIIASQRTVEELEQMLSRALEIEVCGRRYPVASLAQASEMVGAARDRAGVGASQMPVPLIYDGGGRVVAHVSYNGRVWPGAEWRDGDRPLFDPRGAL